ncbi:IclR family transcriptional regulator (plasmid) [Halostagnicola larsenii XH-48]|uniref:IclR family transcriptional regulator n=1 Tax=Halostagnicola larsenii XH-48 TaxID=797299 RepID=W0JT86_9EURY|nr:IclR family transcriptional regulator [Halostagnicola larsenii]AHG01841.1 IclR family transcriptional regulator [Halostagnicola larsenii XH-48]
MTKKEDTQKNRIQAVENAFEIVEEVQAANGCTVRHIMEMLDIPRSTAYVYMKTLEDVGFLSKSGDEYYIGVRFLKYGGCARHTSNIYQVSRVEVDKLAEKAQSVATIGCEDDGQRVLLYRTESGDAVSDNPPTGEYTKMHWTAVGKALLSQKSNAEIKEIAQRYGLPKATDQTHSDIDSLLKDIKEIRSRGYAIENEERSVGVKSIAMPIDIKDDLFENVAISVAGPTSRFTEDRIENELSTLLQETINIIELKMQHY